MGQLPGRCKEDEVVLLIIRDGSNWHGRFALYDAYDTTDFQASTKLPQSAIIPRHSFILGGYNLSWSKWTSVTIN